MTHTSAPTATPQTTEKQGIIALALWFFLGSIGAHRFYMGKVPSGVVMLALTGVGVFTAAILIGIIPLLIVLIWWVIDGVKIIVGLGKAGRDSAS